VTQSDHGIPRSIATAITLIEAERRDLYGQLKALDDALAALKLLHRELRPVDLPPDTKADKKRRRRMYSIEEKEAAVLLVAELGLTMASKRLGISWGTLRDWRNLHSPAVEPSGEVKKYQAQVDDVLALAGGDRILVCSCGLSFDDRDGWKKHNEGLGLAELRNHKLSVHAR
jgi:hypothetical protein